MILPRATTARGKFSLKRRRTRWRRKLFPPGRRKVNEKLQSLAGTAFQYNFTLMGLDGFAHEKQLQARFGSAGTPVAEGAEDMFARAFFQTGTVILYDQANMGTRLKEA